MVGYELFSNWWLQYVYGGATLIGLEVLVAMGLLATNKGTNVMDYWRDSEMWIRRYKIKDGKLMKYYESIELPPGVSKWGAEADKHAPPGTKSVYLTDKQEWGYTEEIPPAPCFVFMSPNMQPAVDEILQKGGQKP